ncbi:MAG: FKBP-type peptidyl-prolyl cis-trans isomerase [Candidatus Saccharimonadales bacterium]
MSTTRLRDRIFAGFGAALFLITSLAFTAYAVVQTGSNNSQTDTSTTDTSACAITQSEGTALPAPEVVKYPDPVTELQITDVEQGTGPAAKNGDCLQMKYYGTLAKDGTLFDENYTKDATLQMELGTGQVIQGWDKGLVGMKEGGTRRLVIPAALGYGAQGAGTIPANSDLVFTVKLVKIK